MDIPAPKNINEKDKPVEGTLKDTTKEEQVVDDAQNKIANLLTSKKYVLSIKEKRTKPFLVFSLGFKRHKKSNKKKQKAKKDKEPASKTKQMIEAGIVGILLIGLYVAIDTGTLDIGWRPPFSLFGNKQNEQILNFTNGSASEK